MRTVSRGFALVLTVVLLALLVLALLALSALSRVSADITATAAYQTQARQNALLGLRVALGELQQYAGDDEAVTGMAGLTGVPPGAGNPSRHWCGVWNASGQFVRWLASGADGAMIPVLNGSDSVALLATGALGADGTDKEHVRVLLVPMMTSTSSGATQRHGGYAWWVGDEGVKLSAVVPDAEAPVPGQKHALDELIASLSPTAPNLDRVEAYAQIALVPASPLTPGQLQSSLHALTCTHRGLLAGVAQAGRLNVNSTSARYWRGVGATYNRLQPADPINLSLTTFANRIRDNFAATVAAGKEAGGPFVSAAAFFDSPLLATALQDSGVTPLEFRDVMLPWLSGRSDTFRIRAYGESANPAEATKVESSAWCEAIVQRRPDALPGFGNRFAIVYFRWLGPEDI
ncbi:hypothetical protein ESB00_10635 [Oleiharenicola lentus]|uniref:General secretion pathway protein GspK n=1 Tax=Oleiharenicola lentus TaxID=2508720 RepID=A0A4Q1CBF1_9BACT|nr:hypothetical protein [Oleiharenicola lentus]RXK56300.1 hypothetical protein ESB00_10635 [Oleiharenicola lentus]